MPSRLPWTQLKPTGALADRLKLLWDAASSPEAREADPLTWVRLALLAGGGRGRLDVRRWEAGADLSRPEVAAALAEAREAFDPAPPAARHEVDGLLTRLGWSVLRVSGGLQIETYLPLEVRTTCEGVDLRLEMNPGGTDGREVALRVSPAQPLPLTLFLKMPAWAQGCLITGLGASAGEVDEDTGLISLARTWGPGDEVGLRFD